MKKSIAFITILITLFFQATIGECSKSDDMIDVIKKQIDDIDTFEILYYMCYSDSRYVFKSEDGMKLENVFGMDSYQIPNEGWVYIWEFGNDQSIVFLYNSHEEMVGIFNLKEHSDLVIASLSVTENCLKSSNCDMESLGIVSNLFAKITNKTHAAYELIWHAKEKAVIKTDKAKKDVWYRTD